VSEKQCKFIPSQEEKNAIAELERIVNGEIKPEDERSRRAAEQQTDDENK